MIAEEELNVQCWLRKVQFIYCISPVVSHAEKTCMYKHNSTYELLPGILFNLILFILVIKNWKHWKK